MRRRTNPLFGRPRPAALPATVRAASASYYRAVRKEGTAADRARKAHDTAAAAFERLERLARQHGTTARAVNVRLHRRYL